MLAQVHACVCMRIQYMHTPHMHKRACTHADTHASTHRHLWQPHARMHIHATARKHTHAHTRAGAPAPARRFLAATHVLAYVHYPTISTDMLNLVSKRQTRFNNDAAVRDIGAGHGHVGSCARL